MYTIFKISPTNDNRDKLLPVAFVQRRPWVNGVTWGMWK